MNAEISMLELKEYLYSTTEASQERSQATRVNSLRSLLLIHRFDVFTWLMSNGVAIPAELIADGAHPKPGNQSPDKPA